MENKEKGSLRLFTWLNVLFDGGLSGELNNQNGPLMYKGRHLKEERNRIKVGHGLNKFLILFL